MNAVNSALKKIIGDKRGFVCAKCGRKDKLELDHVIPFALKRTTNFNEIQLLCVECHHAKSAKEHLEISRRRCTCPNCGDRHYMTAIQRRHLDKQINRLKHEANRQKRIKAKPRLICWKCGTDWEYRGSSTVYASCPDCHASNKMIQKR